MSVPTDNPPDPLLDNLRLSVQEGSPLEGEDGLFAQITAQLEEEGSRLLWRLRSAPGWARGLPAAVAVVGIATLSGLLLRRPDWEIYPALRMSLLLASMSALVGAATLAALRPLHRPLLPTSRAILLVVVAVGATALMAALPPAHTALAVSLAEGPLLSHALPCLGFGFVLGIPVYVLVRLFDRGSTLGPFLAAVAAGVTGDLGLQLHCPITAPTHNLSGHFTVLLAFLAVTAVIETLHRARRAR